MEERLSRWGIGPKTFVPSLICTLIAWWATSAWPDLFVLRMLPAGAASLGRILIAAGLVLWLTGVVTVMKAYNRDQLVTSGVFALVRHPVYAAWITLIFPGLALLLRSWPMLLTPLIAYAIFKRFIHSEDDYLERRFGEAYRNYRGRVNEVIPIPRFWQKSG